MKSNGDYSHLLQLKSLLFRILLTLTTQHNADIDSQV